MRVNIVIEKKNGWLAVIFVLVKYLKNVTFRLTGSV